MTEKSSRGGYDYIGTHAQATHLLVVACSVVAAIYSHTADAVEIVAEALHGLVYLLSQFAGRRHDDAVDGILGIVVLVEHTKYGKQICSRLTGTGLCHTHHVVIVENLGYALLLNWSTFLEPHVIQCVEDIIVQICFFKSHS